MELFTSIQTWSNQNAGFSALIIGIILIAIALLTLYFTLKSAPATQISNTITTTIYYSRSETKTVKKRGELYQGEPPESFQGEGVLSPDKELNEL